MVLFCLDRLDDVTHPPGPVGGDRGEQRPFADEALRRASRVAFAVQGVEVEHVIIEPCYGALPGLDVPATPDTEWSGGGGDVERTGRRGAPVDQQWLIVVALITDAESADVAPLARVGGQTVAGGVCTAVGRAEVELAEAQPVLGGVQLSESVGLLGGGDVALGAALPGASFLPQYLRESARGALAQGVEPVVEHGHVFLLAGDFGGSA